MNYTIGSEVDKLQKLVQRRQPKPRLRDEDLPPGETVRLWSSALWTQGQVTSSEFSRLSATQISTAFYFLTRAEAVNDVVDRLDQVVELAKCSALDGSPKSSPGESPELLKMYLKDTVNKLCRVAAFNEAAIVNDARERIELLEDEVAELRFQIANGKPGDESSNAAVAWGMTEGGNQ
ncbi:hypothetical protein C5Y96_05850 [Blastopirellula marina]|uniref:Uncharacterized protein n=1 Tax=Blastopirellula marina TaxID=124 RepID=A0A2S8G4M0_9BACT|nr:MULTISPECIES: hypothetical protein [Pirellulaceae]PQO39377.1 hypothetical protein C5Y96_05850 [Blastopirellula marina]RCS55685.1 hypothetical protein DTL36_05860 [Bremerella cremea]